MSPLDPNRSSKDLINSSNSSSLSRLDVVETARAASASTNVESSAPVAPDSQPESEFRTLMHRYNHSIQFTSGCGPRAQHYIDTAWNNLIAFTEAHPEFKIELPREKYVSRDDGSGGMATGLATLVANARRDGDDCCLK